MKCLFSSSVLSLVLSVSCVSAQAVIDSENDISLAESISPELIEYDEVFYEERIETIDSIRKYADEKSVVLCVIADNHLNSSRVNQEANESTLQNISCIINHVHLDGVVHLGDMIAESLYKTDGKSNDELYSILNSYIDKVNALHERTFIINGNHDGENGNKFNQDKWLAMVAPLNDDYVVRKEGTPYFYYDIPNKGVRCVFMAVPDNTKTGTIETGFSTRLLSWLKEDALNVVDGTDIIMFAHIPIITASYYTNGMLPNRNSFEGICNAFNSHTAYSDNNVSVDFSCYSSSRIVAYVCGHAHDDLLAVPGYTYQGTMLNGASAIVSSHTYNNSLTFPVIIVGHNFFNYNTSQSNGRNGGIKYARKQGTYTQDLWDTMIYNKSFGEIHMIRFGAGVDRCMRIEKDQ